MSASEEKQEHVTDKRVRHRKKQLYENILKQMEFYFSDANLSKDRFLGNLVKNDPYVPLDSFLKFNKIRSMTHNVKDLAKALRNSSLIECSEDGTKVKRKVPMQPYNADERTVYVESIPVTADLAWLQSVFQQYGTVAYISLPKFKNTQKIKGYAFVEFLKPDEAKKCLEEFIKMNCKLPTSMSPEELSTVKMFSVTEPPQDKDNERKNAEETPENPNDHESEPPMKKVKREKNNKLVDDKNESDTSIDKDNIINNDEFIKDKTKKQKLLEASSVDQDENSNSKLLQSDMNKKKSCRKRSNKERKERSLSKNNEATKCSMFGLQVLSKAEWKSLRNKYLDLQRKHMRELKKALRSNHPLLYKEPLVTQNEIDTLKPHSGITRKEGVLVKVYLNEPCVEVKEVKRRVKSNIHVQYVELKEGQSEMVIRFDTPDAAQQYCDSGIYKSCRILMGAEADESWSRAESDWAKRRRGREKLQQRVVNVINNVNAPKDTSSLPKATNTHIRFED